MQATFSVGDKVKSAPDSSDIFVLRKCWHATILAVRPVATATDGYAYETLGYWDGESKRKKPTLRQLWSKHLVKEDN
jgi:hypothetical protein